MLSSFLLSGYAFWFFSRVFCNPVTYTHAHTHTDTHTHTHTHTHIYIIIIVSGKTVSFRVKGPQSVPFAYREKLIVELELSHKQGIIMPVTEVTRCNHGDT